MGPITVLGELYEYFEIIQCGKKSYDNSSKFYEDYFGNNVELLVSSIKQFQKLKGKGHKKDELCLADMLKSRK